jgi:hypothetical protein
MNANNFNYGLISDYHQDIDKDILMSHKDAFERRPQSFRKEFIKDKAILPKDKPFIVKDRPRNQKTSSNSNTEPGNGVKKKPAYGVRERSSVTPSGQHRNDANIEILATNVPSSHSVQPKVIGKDVSVKKISYGAK